MSGAKSTSDAAAALTNLVRRLAQAREAAGLTQADLARKLKKKNQHQSLVSKIESGERRLHLEDFVRWARAVGKDPAALLLQFEKEMGGRPRVRLKDGE